MAKKELDKLSLDMIECQKAGFGIHYGAWKATQDRTVVVKKNDELPEGWRICKFCGEPFKLANKGKNRIYCDVSCQRKASNQNRDADKKREYCRRYKEKQRLKKAGLLA